MRALLIAILLSFCVASAIAAQTTPLNIRAEISAQGPAQPGTEWLVALHFSPRSDEWHGYWSNPGDAGLGMTLDWSLPEGWTAGEPRYPVPQKLLIGGLMNHVFEGSYAVIVPIRIPAGANIGDVRPIAVDADYLACTDRICVPQRARLALDPARAVRDPRFDRWLAAIAPPLGTPAQYEAEGTMLRIGIPLPAAASVGGEPHVFLEAHEFGQGLRPEYSGTQAFFRKGDLLVAEVLLRRNPSATGDTRPAQPEKVLSGVLSFGDGNGVIFSAQPGAVALDGAKPLRPQVETAFGWLILAALAGGLLLNIMPCVFPILSLKALSLAGAGGSEGAARRDAVAYTAGATLACAGLGAMLLVLRSAGEQVGWAFQLQEPAVVAGLFVLSLAITANFLGLFQIPGLSRAGGPGGASSFATGLLAAFVATPCTGPFMAAAMGAALLLPTAEAMALFVALGIGLALPFLVIGFVPGLRRRLPRPGPWMAQFKRWMALPMGLTALALAWLVWRIGGPEYALLVAVLAFVVLALLAICGRQQDKGRRGSALLLGSFVAGVAGAALLPVPDRPSDAGESLLRPRPFSEATLAEARASGRPVFVWFTADWCVTCKVNEKAAIDRRSTQTAFAAAGVIALRGDWTRRDPDIARFLTQHGAAGVPLYLWYPASGEGRQLPQVLTPGMLANLARSSQRAPPAAK